MNKFIVFVSKDHYNPVGIIRSLGEHGIKPYVVVVKSKPKLVKKSKFVKKCFVVDNSMDGLNLIISKFGHEKEKPVILTGDDVTVSTLDQNYDLIKNKFLFFNAGQKGRIKKYMDKDVLNELAISCGFKVPKTWKIVDKVIPKDVEYPVITKAINSFGDEWKDIVFICNSEKELASKLSGIKSKTILIQQYITKVNEISYEGISINKGKETKFLMAFNQAYCISDKYTPLWNGYTLNDAEFVKKASLMISRIGLEGVFEFEFLEGADGHLYFLEINFRNTVLGWATNVAGMSNVVNWSKAMINGKIPNDISLTVPANFKAIAECFDYDVRVKGKMLTRKEWMKEYKKCDAKLYRGRNDIMPFLSFLFYKAFHRKDV